MQSALVLIENFRANLRRLMEAKGVSVRQLAALSGVNYVTISRVMNGKQTNLTMDLCEKLAAALEIPAEEMFQNPKKKSPTRT